MLFKVVALALVAPAFAAPTRDLFARDNDGSLSSTSGGGVASEVSECSAIGIDVLKQGGNAVDASESCAFTSWDFRTTCSQCSRAGVKESSSSCRSCCRAEFQMRDVH